MKIIYSFFKESKLGRAHFPWELSYKQAIKLIWEKVENIQKIPGVKILSSITADILELSCRNSPDYFKLNEQLTLKVIIKEIFEKFNNYKTYKKFIKETVEENDEDDDLKARALKIEQILLRLLFNITLLNHFIQKINTDENALIKILNFPSFRYFRQSTIARALTQSENYLMAVRDFLTHIENEEKYILSEMQHAKEAIDNNPFFLEPFKKDFNFIDNEVANFVNQNKK